MSDPGDQRGTAGATIPQPPPDETQATPEVTYTQADLEARLTKAGRDDATLQRERQALAEEQAAWQRHQEESFEDDPGGLRAFRERQAQKANKERADKLEAENARLREDKEARDRRDDANEVAAKHTVDAAKLLKFAPKGASKAEMEEMAKEMPKVGGPKAPLKVDSNLGGAGEGDRHPTATDKIRAGWDELHP